LWVGGSQVFRDGLGVGGGGGEARSLKERGRDDWKKGGVEGGLVDVLGGLIEREREEREGTEMRNGTDEPNFSIFGLCVILW